MVAGGGGGGEGGERFLGAGGFGKDALTNLQATERVSDAGFNII